MVCVHFLNRIIWFVLILVLIQPASALAQGETIRISETSLGGQANNTSKYPAASDKCFYVAFESWADDLVLNDTNFRTDIFVHQRSTGYTTRVSVSSTGDQGNKDHKYPSISADGRFVVFESESTNLVPNDNNWQCDIFVRDRYLKQTERVSISSTGKEGNGGSYFPSISEDGRYVSFESWATNLVVGDTSPTYDIFVHDRLLKTTLRASVDSSGAQANGHSRAGFMSPCGRFVAFQSEANNLVSGDTNGCLDVFIHELAIKKTTRVSVDSSGVQGNFKSYWASISEDGYYIAFQSEANNLVPGDNFGAMDIFVHERLTGLTERVSVSSSGAEAKGSSAAPCLSKYGRYVSFNSSAWNLVPNDNNFKSDIFVHDRQTKETRRVSVSSSGSEGNYSCDSDSAISPDGKFVAFCSYADNLVPNDTNNAGDVFIHSDHPLKALTTDTHTLPETGGTANLTLNAKAAQANRTYLIFSGFTGTIPGTPLPGGFVTLPLNWDAFTNMALNLVNTPFFVNFAGVLDASGGATAQFNILNTPGAAGVTVYFAFGLYFPWDYASNPVGIEIIP